jgi:hypothetical protein
MNAVHKYYWKINIQADAPHVALESLRGRVFELETLDPPPEVGESFTFYLDAVSEVRSSAEDRSVEVTVLKKTRVLEHREGRPMECRWYTALVGRIVGSAPIP